MSVIYPYIDPVAPPQLIGIYGSPMERLGMVSSMLLERPCLESLPAPIESSSALLAWLVH